MIDYKIDDFNKIQNSRKNKTDDLLNKIIEGLRSSKSPAVAFSAQELYNKPTAHYYTLSKAFKASKELNALVKEVKWKMSETKHANFELLAILKK